MPITTVQGAIVDCVLRIESSTERLMRPVPSTIGLFEGHVLTVRKLVKEFADGAVCSHTFRENWSHKTRIVRGVNSCERVALSSGVVCQSQGKKTSSDTTNIVTVTASSPPR